MNTEKNPASPTPEPTGPRKITPQDPPQFPCELLHKDRGWMKVMVPEPVDVLLDFSFTHWRPLPTAPATPPATETATPETPRFKLWRHMMDEHKLTLLESELDEIIDKARAVEPLGEASGERIGGWRITPEGLKMNGPTPPTKEETQAYLAHERADLLDANAKLDSQLAGMSKAFDELRAHVVRAEEDNATLRHSLAATEALVGELRGALKPFASLLECDAIDASDANDAPFLTGASPVQAFMGVRRTFVTVGDVRAAKELLTLTPETALAKQEQARKGGEGV